MSVPSLGLGAVTGGLATSNGTFLTIVSDGLPLTSRPPVRPPSISEITVPIRTTAALPDGRTGTQLIAAAPVRDVDGQVVVPSSDGFVNLGSGHLLSFDETSQQGKITPAIANNILRGLDDPNVSFSGSDLRIMLEIADFTPTGNSPPRFAKQLLECTTLSISVHRTKAPMPAAGFINPRGFARGRRTIAGTIILTQFTVDVLMRFLQGVLLQQDSSKSDYYTKTDQLPPLNMTLIFSNEGGYASYRRVLGIELVTDGVTYSSNDMFTEQTISYLAADMTPLLPLNLSNFWQLGAPGQDQRRAREKSPMDIWDSIALPAGDVG